MAPITWTLGPLDPGKANAACWSSSLHASTVQVNIRFVLHMGTDCLHILHAQSLVSCIVCIGRDVMYPLQHKELCFQVVVDC